MTAEAEIDFGSLDYRCDPRVDAEHLNGWISVRQGSDTSWSTFMWVRQMEDGLWAVIDDQGGLSDTYTLGESAIYSVIGLPIPSAYIKDTRVQPLDRDGQWTAWHESPEWFFLEDGNGNEYEVKHFGPDSAFGVWGTTNPEVWGTTNPDCWVALAWSSGEGYRSIGNEHTLLDEALYEVLGDADRPWNAED